MTIHPSVRNSRAKRRGAAAAELCVCLPLFVLVIAGSLETCSLIHLRESMCVASYEAARIAAKSGADREEAIEQSRELLEARGIKGVEIVIKPENLADLISGSPVSVEITTPAHAQSMLPKSILGDHQISSQTVLVKE